MNRKPYLTQHINKKIYRFFDNDQVKLKLKELDYVYYDLMKLITELEYLEKIEKLN